MDVVIVEPEPEPEPSRPKKTVFSASEVKALLQDQDGKERVTTEANPASARSSSVWADFHLVTVDGFKQNLVQCLACKAVLKHTSGHDGSAWALELF